MNKEKEFEKLPKRCEAFKINALKACNVMDDPLICKDIITGMVNKCSEWLKQEKKDEYSDIKKN
tara:strand:- start:1519 stop:1710 length:192 start_codon:yes stop_codon:yes gene_type:complete